MFDRPVLLTTRAPEPGPASRHSSLRRFRQARLQASLQEALDRMRGRSSRLLSFDEVSQHLRLVGRADRGVRAIPLDAIVGSVGRYADFTRTFLPRRDADENRWAGVQAAFAGDRAVSMPPIEVYQVGQAYFVLDGNHRVSVARQAGRTDIEAHVIEVPSPVPLAPGVSPADLIVKAEQAQFLERTGLACCPEMFDLSLTEPGGYARLSEHITAYGAALAERAPQPVSDGEAAQAWYQELYLPVALALRERGVLQRFPGRTETDLYLWVFDHRQRLEAELGWEIRPQAALADLLAREAADGGADQAGAWRQARVLDRYSDRLFADILVAISGGPEGWAALDYALGVARPEGARLHGLHVIPPGVHPTPATIEALRSRFTRRCAEAGVPAHLALEAGRVTERLRERARLADLVVLGRQPEPGEPGRRREQLSTLARQSVQPLLVVPLAPGRQTESGRPGPLRRALLAYDGSPKAKEALFVATYLAESWKTTLRVVALPAEGQSPVEVLNYPRAYLEIHEVAAEYVEARGDLPEVVRAAASEPEPPEIVLLGGQGAAGLWAFRRGSPVEALLAAAPLPLFICR